MEIVKLKPAIKSYIWGGQRLSECWGKEKGHDCISETWELSLHKDGLCLVDSGNNKGKTLLDTLSREDMGTRASEFAMFPQLIKLIDARDNLSLQVHPSDEFALSVEGEYGKTEVWYILDAEENAGVFWGLKKAISLEEMSARIQNNTLLDVMNFVPALRGDVFFIEAGTIHAICKGLTLAEIQQNSNITYRVYDYNRVDASGKGRELHIDKALLVSNLAPQKLEVSKRTDAKIRKIAQCKYFDVTEFVGRDIGLQADSDSFNAVVIVSGNGYIGSSGNHLELSPGDTFFVPASFGEYSVTSQNNNEVIILVSKQ